MTGYNANFFEEKKIGLPALPTAQKKQRAPIIGKARSYELKYTHFSIVQNKERKFAFFTATNINGKQWKPKPDANKEFILEERILPAHQTGNELYDFDTLAALNDFDKGHITKFQDPQWGSAATINQAAADTMKFVNCLPQHHSLNRGAWKSLEDYIIKKFTKKTGVDGSKITVFAGPSLLPNDPFYIDAINGKPLQIPVHFWKVIIYLNRSNVLSAVAFLMSQKSTLLKHNFVVENPSAIRELAPSAARVPDFFSDFTKGEPYQVSISFIQKITGFRFGINGLHQPYTKEEATEIIYKRIEIPSAMERQPSLTPMQRPLSFEYEGITL